MANSPFIITDSGSYGSGYKPETPISITSALPYEGELYGIRGTRVVWFKVTVPAGELRVRLRRGENNNDRMEYAGGVYSAGGKLLGRLVGGTSSFQAKDEPTVVAAGTYLIGVSGPRRRAKDAFVFTGPPIEIFDGGGMDGSILTVSYKSSSAVGFAQGYGPTLVANTLASPTLSWTPPPLPSGANMPEVAFGKGAWRVLSGRIAPIPWLSEDDIEYAEPGAQWPMWYDEPVTLRPVPGHPHWIFEQYLYANEGDKERDGDNMGRNRPGRNPGTFGYFGATNTEDTVLQFDLTAPLTGAFTALVKYTLRRDWRSNPVVGANFKPKLKVEFLDAKGRVLLKMEGLFVLDISGLGLRPIPDYAAVAVYGTDYIYDDADFYNPAVVKHEAWFAYQRAEARVFAVMVGEDGGVTVGTHSPLMLDELGQYVSGRIDNLSNAAGNITHNGYEAVGAMATAPTAIRITLQKKVGLLSMELRTPDSVPFSREWWAGKKFVEESPDSSAVRDIGTDWMYPQYD